MVLYVRCINCENLLIYNEECEVKYKCLAGRYSFKKLSYKQIIAQRKCKSHENKFKRSKL